MKLEDVEAFFKPKFPIGSVISSMETGRCGVITAIEVREGWVSYAGFRFDGKQFACTEEGIVLQARTLNEFLDSRF